MAFTPNVPSTSAFSPPANMQEIAWVQDPVTLLYDIQNEYTLPGNPGNLQVIQSKIQITLSSLQGEWAADPSFGIPIAIVNQNSDSPDVVAQIFANQVLEIQNVNNVAITSFDYVATTRSFSGVFTANTVYGVVPIVI